MLKLNFLKIVLTVIFIYSFSYLSAQADSKAGIAGMYSDMCYNDEGGDLLGMEIFLVYTEEGTSDNYYVVFQYSEGAPTVPIVIKADVNEKDGTVDFMFPNGAPITGKFHGVIEKSGMRVGVQGTGIQNELLKRQPSYWAQRRVCK